MKIGDPLAAREWFLRARSAAPDAIVSARLSAAERAISIESPLEDEGTAPIASSASSTAAVPPRRRRLIGLAKTGVDEITGLGRASVPDRQDFM